MKIQVCGQIRYQLNMDLEKTYLVFIDVEFGELPRC